MSFIVSEWRKLALINYSIDPSILKEHIPFGTELDLWKGNCYLSLVGFMFLNTRVLGVKIPYHINFEEVNLRFYVKRKEGDTWKRGVVFIKEIVPKSMISFVANLLYKENYETMPMMHRWEEGASFREIEYAWKKSSKWNSIALKTELESQVIERESETEFITEHYWGYARINEIKTNEYEVTHPKWRHYPVQAHSIEVDFKGTYGSKFEFLDQLQPASVMLAEGSRITVENKRTIR